MRLQEFRKKYPQYNDVPDKQLADSLYEKFYASAITKDDFYSQIGLTPAEPFAQPEPITGMESAFATAPVLILFSIVDPRTILSKISRSWTVSN